MYNRFFVYCCLHLYRIWQRVYPELRKFSSARGNISFIFTPVGEKLIGAVYLLIFFQKLRGIRHNLLFPLCACLHGFLKSWINAQAASTTFVGYICLPSVSLFCYSDIPALASIAVHLLGERFFKRRIVYIFIHPSDTLFIDTATAQCFLPYKPWRGDLDLVSALADASPHNIVSVSLFGWLNRRYVPKGHLWYILRSARFEAHFRKSDVFEVSVYIFCVVLDGLDRVSALVHFITPQHKSFLRNHLIVGKIAVQKSRRCHHSSHRRFRRASMSFIFCKGFNRFVGHTKALCLGFCFINYHCHSTHIITHSRGSNFSMGLYSL